MPKPLKPTIMILHNLPTAKRQFTVHGFLSDVQEDFDSADASSQEGLNDQSCTAVPEASKGKKGKKTKK